MDLVCLGEILVDMFPAEIGRPLVDVSAFLPKPGGAPANVAVAAARLGLRVAFIGKVGEDAFGHKLVAVLAEQGVETRGMRYDAQARTTLAFIAMPDKNRAEFVFYRNPGADMRLKPDDLDKELLVNTTAFHFGSISLIDEPSRSATIEAIRLARDSNALISFDVNFRPSLWQNRAEAVERIKSIIPEVNLLKINEVELTLLCPDADIEQGTQYLLNMGPRLCVVTMGAQGSYFITKEAGRLVPGFAVKTVDATGCGDAFIAGLLVKLIENGDWRSNLTSERLYQALRFANAVGALTALQIGVIPALPTLDQVNTFLLENT